MTREQTAFALFVLLIGIFGVAGAVVTMEPGWIVAAPYEYSRVDEKNYRLCAVFALESAPWNSWAPVTRILPAPAVRSGARVIVSRNSPPATFRFVPRPSPPLSGVSAAPWKHSAGAHCFEFDDRSSAPIEEAADRETKT